MNRKTTVAFGASLLASCLGSLIAGLVVRAQFRGRSHWLVQDLVYVTRDQHLSNSFPFVSNLPLWTLASWPFVGIAVVFLVRWVRASSPGLSALPEIVGGLILGGGLANAMEAQAAGSVTDFLGIRLSGTYSAGDIVMDVGSALVPAVVIQIAKAQGRSLLGVLTSGAVFYVAVVLVGVAKQDYALAVLVTLVTGAFVSISLIRQSETRRAGTPTGAK